MTYTQLAVAGVLAALAADHALLRTRLVRRRVFWVAYAIVLAFQLLSNGVLTGRGVVRYDERAILGWRVAYAPVEDVLFGFAMVLLTQSTWVWLGRRAARPVLPARPAQTARPAPPAREAMPDGPAMPDRPDRPARRDRRGRASGRSG